MNKEQRKIVALLYGDTCMVKPWPDTKLKLARHLSQEEMQALLPGDKVWMAHLAGTNDYTVPGVVQENTYLLRIQSMCKLTASTINIDISPQAAFRILVELVE